MNQKNTIISTSYFPPIPYFQSLVYYNQIHVEMCENYGRHSIRNRTKILGANGVILLSVPIKKSSTKNIKKIEISNTGWQKKHINSIQSAYGSAPYFIFYFDQIKQILNKNHQYLIDLNNEILDYFLYELDIIKKIHFTDTYFKTYSSLFIDQRSDLNLLHNYKEYQQIFGTKFISNLSVIDLIFNLGPNAKDYIFLS